MSGKPLVDRDYLLEKSSGMGGWTYTIIPEIAPDPHAPFGWVKVKGTIDGVEIRNYHLLPGLKGSGVVFLSVKADLRKKNQKTGGRHNPGSAVERRRSARSARRIFDLPRRGRGGFGVLRFAERERPTGLHKVDILIEKRRDKNRQNGKNTRQTFGTQKIYRQINNRNHED